MNMKKNLLYTLFASILIFGAMWSTPIVLAANNFGLDKTADSACTGGACFNKSETPTSITTSVINIGLSMVFLAFFGLSLYAGFRWMLARGNEEHVTTAKHTLEAAIIGLVIVSASYAITNVIMDKLGG